MGTADTLFNGLKERGFSTAQAHGIMANFQAESGLDAGINERNPTVPGSRGGYGLYQLTGPRRRGYEQYATDLGSELNNPNTQLDYMMQELGSTEKRAMGSLMDTTTPEEAARVFSKQFLRPGHDNTEQRMRTATAMAATGYDDAPQRYMAGSDLTAFADEMKTGAASTAQVAQGFARTNELYGGAGLASLRGDTEIDQMQNRRPPRQPSRPDNQIGNVYSPSRPMSVPPDASPRPPTRGGPASPPSPLPPSMGLPNKVTPGPAGGAPLPPSMGLPNKVTHGPAGGAPLPPSMGVPKRAPTAPPALAGGGGTPSSPAGGAQAATDKLKTPFVNKIAEFMYPNQADPVGSFKRALGGIGVGLGQMSQGNTVDLQPYFNSIASNRQGIINSQNTAANSAEQRRLQAGQLAVTARNSDTTAARLAYDMAKEGGGAEPAGASYDALVAKYPEIKLTADLAAGGDKDAQKQVAQFAAEKAAEYLGTQAEKDGLSRFMAAKDSTGRYAALQGLTPEEQKSVVDMGGAIMGLDQKGTEAMRTGYALYEIDPARYDNNPASAIEHAAKITSGSPTGKSTERVKTDLKASTAISDGLRVRADAAHDSMIALDLAASTTKEMIADNSEVSGLDKIARTAGSWVGSIAGSTAQQKFFDTMGIDATSSYKLSNVEAAMMRAIAASYSGQGSISDGERKTMAQEVLSGEMTNEQRMIMISKLRSEAMMIQANEQYYSSSIDKKNDDENWNEVSHDINSGRPAQREIIRAATAHGEFSYTDSPGAVDDVRSKYEARFPFGSKRFENEVMPNISKKYAERYRHALPRFGQGSGEFDKAGNERPILNTRGLQKQFGVYIDSATGEVVYVDLGV